MAEYGHTFASDLIINYETLRREGSIKPGQLLLFASAGIGFTWGVTLARACNQCLFVQHGPEKGDRSS